MLALFTKMLTFAPSRAVESPAFHLSLEAGIDADTVGCAQVLAQESFGPRQKLANLMLLEVLQAPATQSAPPEELVSALWHAVAAQDRRSTVLLWDKVVRYKDAVHLGTPNPKRVYTTELLQFLVFDVRRPQLALAVIGQLEIPSASVCKTLYELRPNAITAMVAAVMYALERAKEHDLARLPGNGRIFWPQLLGALLAALPKRPSPMWTSYTNPSLGAPKSMSLIEAVVSCPSHSATMTKDVLRQCNFSLFALENAWVLSLQQNNVLLPVHGALYARLILPRGALDKHSNYPGLLTTVLKHVWAETVTRATGWQDVVVSSAASGTVRVPRVHEGGAQNHPDFFVELLNAMASAHTACAADANQMSQLLLWALEAVLPFSHLTHIVEELLRLMEERGLLESSFGIQNFLNSILSVHLRIYPIIKPHLVSCSQTGVRTVECRHAKSMTDVLRTRIRVGDRAAVAAILETYDNFPEGVLTPADLVNYVRSFCQACQSLGLGDSAQRVQQATAMREFSEFLRVGEFTKEAHAKALVAASECRAGIAVDVLVLPPYNTPMPHGDHFVHAVLDVLLAPGAAAVAVIGADFAKRQRGSGR